MSQKEFMILIMAILATVALALFVAILALL